MEVSLNLGLANTFFSSPIPINMYKEYYYIIDCGLKNWYKFFVLPKKVELIGVFYRVLPIGSTRVHLVLIASIVHNIKDEN